MIFSQPNPTAGMTGQTRVAFYGDSYTLGTGLVDRGDRWSTRLCQQRGWSEFNPSVNGLGFINNRMRFGAGSGDEPDQIISENPDIVIVTMGLNDNFSFAIAADAIHDQIDDDFDRLSSALPGARLIAVEPFWYSDERPESIAVISGWVRAAAARVGADFIPGASHWIEGHPEWMAPDRLHPNKHGYDEITARMDAALSTLNL